MKYRSTRNHGGPNEPKMYDVKRVELQLTCRFARDQSVLNAMLTKIFGVWMQHPSVVENVLGQLTESRGTNEDRL